MQERRPKTAYHQRSHHPQQRSHRKTQRETFFYLIRPPAEKLSDKRPRDWLWSLCETELLVKFKGQPLAEHGRELRGRQLSEGQHWHSAFGLSV